MKHTPAIVTTVIGLSLAAQALAQPRLTPHSGDVRPIALPPGPFAPVLEPALEPAQQIIAGVQALPWGMHAVVAVAMVAGLVLWCCGRHVLRPVVITLSALAGAGLGFVLTPTLLPDAGLSPYVGAAGGLIAGVLAGFLLYRLTLAGLFAVVIGSGTAVVAAGALALLGAGGVNVASSRHAGTGLGLMPLVQLGGDEQPRVLHGDRWTTPTPPPEHEEPPGGSPDEPPADDEPADEAEPGPETAPPGPTRPAKSPGTPSRGTTKPAARGPAGAAGAGAVRDPLEGWSPADGGGASLSGSAGDRARGFVRAVRADLEDRWQRASAAERTLVATTAFIGALLGAVTGLTMPAWAAGSVTALAGAAVWLPAGTWLAHALRLPLHERLDMPALGWAVAWIVVALAGTLIQWSGLIKPAGGSAGGAGEGGSPRRRAGTRSRRGR